MNLQFRLGFALSLFGLLLAGCGGGRGTIKIAGSDTMVNLAQAWAEEYSTLNPQVRPEIAGGGSGVGIAKLIDGTVELANASREMKAEEKELAKRNSGKDVKEIPVALDALAVYVHKDNPLDSISLEDLAEIYGEGGSITQWSQLEGWPKESGAQGGEIVRVSRQNNSGTYVYFREAVLGEQREYKLGSIDQSGSKDVVELVSNTPQAIGYSGMGYTTPGVKMLKVSKEKGGEAIAPTMEAAMDNSYPLARPLYIYTLGEPTGQVKEYIDWILSPEGQRIVEKVGYVPIGSQTGDDFAPEPEAESAAQPEDEPPAAEPDAEAT